MIGAEFDEYFPNVANGGFHRHGVGYRSQNTASSYQHGITVPLRIMGWMSQDGKKTPGPGPKFDRTEVLDRLVVLFWEHGYVGTSHDMMRRATGLSGSSLYNAFGDKRSIFAHVLDRYHERSVVLIEPLLTGSAGVNDLIAWVAVIRDRVSDPDAPAGCLMVATMGSLIGAEEATRERTEKNLQRVQDALTSTLQRAAENGEIDQSDVESLAASFTASYLGILTAAKGGRGPATALEMIDGVEVLILNLRQH